MEKKKEKTNERSSQQPFSSLFSLVFLPRYFQRYLFSFSLAFSGSSRERDKQLMYPKTATAASLFPPFSPLFLFLLKMHLLLLFHPSVHSFGENLLLLYGLLLSPPKSATSNPVFNAKGLARKVVVWILQGIGR